MREEGQLSGFASRSRLRRSAFAVLFSVAFSACRFLGEEPGSRPDPGVGAGADFGQREDRGARNPYVLSRSELENIRVRRFEELLIARFPSVRVSRRGAEYVIRIRGAGNLTGGGDPLFIVDGMPTPVSSLANLNPADIFRIEVVENHRTAFYGIRGAFGVIIVTTIRP